LRRGRTNYLATTGHYDISSVVGQFGPYVWGNNSASFNVIGSIFPGVGAGVTSDGMATGEVRGVTITKTNAEVEDPNDNLLYDMTLAQKPGSTVCQGGDSGGPWYQHTSSPYPVEAVGIQEGEIIVDGVPDPSYCAYEQINDMLSLVKGTIQHTS
jgi:hypothetical protein